MRRPKLTCNITSMRHYVITERDTICHCNVNSYGSKGCVCIQLPSRHTGHGRKSVGTSLGLNTCERHLVCIVRKEEVVVSSTREFKAQKRPFRLLRQRVPSSQLTEYDPCSVASNIRPYPWENAINIADHVRLETRKGESGGEIYVT